MGLCYAKYTVSPVPLFFSISPIQRNPIPLHDCSAASQTLFFEGFLAMSLSTKSVVDGILPHLSQPCML